MIYKHLIAFFFVIIRAFSNIFHNAPHITPYKKYLINLNLVIMIMNLQDKQLNI